MRPFLIVVVFILSLAPPAAAVDPPTRVLFLGNSLTYANDLPQMVEALSANGKRRIAAGMIAGPNMSLEDLWRDPRVLEAIRSKHWDVVVMQQGPSALPESRVNLVEWARAFGDEIRENGALPALYMVWPSMDRGFDRQRVAASYREAARACGCRILPAGEAWQLAWTEDATVSLYGSDGFHPNREGSFLAALVIWSVLTGESPSSAKNGLVLRDGTIVRIDAKLFAVFSRAAEEALK